MALTAINRISGQNLKQIGDSKLEKKQDGDWWIYQWFNEKEKSGIFASPDLADKSNRFG